MVTHSRKCLIALLMIVSAASFVNVLVMYWFPHLFPLSAFSAVRLMFLAFIEKRYWLIPVSILICALLFRSALSVRKRRILLPVLSLLYVAYDFVFVLRLLIDGLRDGYWKTYIVQTLVLLALIVLLCIHGWDCLRTRAQHRPQA